MSGKEGFALAVVLVILVSTAVSAADDPWDALYKITWKRTYLVIKRDRQCIEGEFTSLDGHSVSVKQLNKSDKTQPTPKWMTIERKEVLRIGERLRQIDVVYSARSCWNDVKALDDIVPSEYVLVIMKDGKVRKGKPITISDEALQFAGESDLNQISKRAIAKLYYVRVKPLSAGAEYSEREMFYLDPRLWPYLLRVAPKISVLLYDSSAPEDNTELNCVNKAEVREAPF